MNIPELLQGRRICVCAGSGGVGKTTTSAVIGLGMAALGLRVCVITIDPARRLASALGLDELSNVPSRVGADRLTAAGLEVRGELWAMMLDPKATFDEFIDATAADPARAAAVKANPIYQGLSSAVAGSQEFTAVSKLYDLAGSERFDLLVLDTPPARNALDFLDAPRRLVGFLEGRALQALIRPTGVGVRLLSVGAGPLLGGLRRVTGVDLVSDITTFFTLLGPMGSAFSSRAASVEVLLSSPETAFVLIASAQRTSIDEALWFARTLTSRRLPFAGVVVNRFHHDLGGAEVDRDVLVRALEQQLSADTGLAERVVAAFVDFHRLARRDGAQLERLVAGLAGEPVLAVPQFDEEIGDLAGLLRIHAFLFGSEQQRADLIAALVA